MRSEPCVCGGTILAPSTSESGPYVEGHNATYSHQLWRRLKERHNWVDERLPIGLTTYRDPRRPTAVVDVSGSASAVGGAE